MSNNHGKQQEKMARLAAFSTMSLLLCLIHFGCPDRTNTRPDPPITEAGRRGVYESVYIDIEVLHEIGSAIPDTLECGGEEYSFKVIARDRNVECEIVDWNVLYAEAKRQVDGRVAQFNCPDRCELNSRIVRQRAFCDGSHPTVEIYVVVKCVPFNEPPTRPDGLPFQPDGSIRGPFDESDGLDWGDPTETIDCLLWQELQDALHTYCPTTYYFRVNRYVPVANCNVQDFRPYIEKARADAMILWNGLTCRPECYKQPLAELWVEWNCYQSEANGKSYVSVQSVWSAECR